MKTVETALIVFYRLVITFLTCYMFVNHGWGWVFLLLLAFINIEVNNNDEENIEE